MERLIKFIKGLISAIITGLIIAGIIWALLCIEVILTKKAFAYSYDVTEPCGLDAEQFEEILQDSMKPYAKAFIRAESDYGINAMFLASIVKYESGGCKSKLATTKCNVFGWRGQGGWKEFDSIEHCIDWCSWRIYKNYILKGRDTVNAIGVKYCDDRWASDIKSIWSNYQYKSVLLGEDTSGG